MRIYAILENVRIAYIYFHFFPYGQTQAKHTSFTFHVFYKKTELCFLLGNLYFYAESSRNLWIMLNLRTRPSCHSLSTGSRCGVQMKVWCRLLIRQQLWCDGGFMHAIILIGVFLCVGYVLYRTERPHPFPTVVLSVYGGYLFG